MVEKGWGDRPPAPSPKAERLGDQRQAELKQRGVDTSQSNPLHKAVTQGNKENKPAREFQDASHRQTVTPTQNIPHRPAMDNGSQQSQKRQLGQSRNPSPVQASMRTSHEHSRMTVHTQPRPDGHDKAQDVFSRDAQDKSRQNIQNREKTKDKGKDYER